ncbi:PEP-CTERM sorting domain-containing protein [Kiritimatiellaeota bacterium B1221]|nr:PEP-CTERM sorting domain-containing protein [Kiritimatiellaeota bacterium B1221]
MKIHTHMAPFVLLVLSAFMLTPAQAYFLDNLDNTDNLIPTNALPSTTTVDDNSGSGIVTFNRNLTNIGEDTFVDWRESGTGFFDLATESQFVVTPEASGTNNVGAYNISLYFFNASDFYVGEGQVIADTTSTSVQSVDVTSAASSFGTATQWYARIRLVNGPGTFEFDSFAATIPEPSTGILVVLALGSLFLFRGRFRA